MKFRFLSCVLGTLALFIGLTAQAQDANLRLVHLAPFADTVAGTSVTVTVTLQESTTGAAITVPNVQYEDSTAYQPLTPGTYAISVTPTGGDTPIPLGDVALAAGTDYTAAVIGNNDTQPLEVLLIEDLNRAPEQGFFRARLVHAAPVSANENDTLVDIFDGQRELANDVPYKAVSDFGRSNPGEVTVIVTGATGSPELVTPQPFNIEAGYIGTFFVIGDGMNQPLSLYALPFDPESSPSGELQIASTCTTASYFQPSTDGQGINLESIADQNRIFGYWYTFNADGSEQVWYFMDGLFSGTGNAANLTVFKRFGGASFDQGVADEAEVVGTFDIVFPSDTTATAAFNITDPEAGLNNAEGTLNLERLTPIQGDSCEGFVGFEPAAEPEPEPEPETVSCVINEENTDVVIENVECEDGSDVGSACTVTIESETFTDVVCTAS